MDLQEIKKIAGIVTESTKRTVTIEAGSVRKAPKAAPGGYVVSGHLYDEATDQETPVKVYFDYSAPQKAVTDADSPVAGPASPAEVDIIEIHDEAGNKVKGSVDKDDIMDAMDSVRESVKSPKTKQLNEMRRIAGLPLVESYDDDEDPDVKIAMKDKRQREFEKRNKKEISDANAEVDKKKKEAAAKAAEKKAAAKAEKPAAEKAPAKEDDKAEDKPEPKAEPAEKKSRQREGSKAGRGRAWLQANPQASLKTFKSWAAEELGMSAAAATTYFYNMGGGKRRQALTESWMIRHPKLDTYFLAENRSAGRYQWIDMSREESLEPCIFESEKAATTVGQHLQDFRNQAFEIYHFIAD